jgi:hypothetical protein
MRMWKWAAACAMGGLFCTALIRSVAGRRRRSVEPETPPPPQSKRGVVTEASEDSFPASDAPSWSATTGVGRGT